MEKLRELNTTLLLIMQNKRILLAEKQRGFAKGTYNGIGGKQDPGETIEQAMVRETQEEIGVTPVNYQKIGLINFDVWYKGEHVDLKLHIYKCAEFEGTIIETEEMKPQWFSLDNIPFDKMLPDDKLWFDKVLEGKCVGGFVKMDQNLKLIENKIEEISALSLVKISA